MFERNFFKWRGGVNPLQIVVALGSFYLGNNILIDSWWGTFFKIFALLVFINLCRTISWWLKGYPG
jgi:hypothetical protein